MKINSTNTSQQSKCKKKSMEQLNLQQQHKYHEIFMIITTKYIPVQFDSFGRLWL